MWGGEAHRFGELWCRKGKSCSDNEAHLCCLGHGDILVMDGQCQDKFLHCTDPGLEQERINVAFRWIKQHVPSCSLLRAGVTCCLPTCAQGSSVSVTGFAGNGVLWAFRPLLSALCIWEELVLLVYFFLCTGLGSRGCASCWTRPLGGGRWRHYLYGLWEDCCAAHKTAGYHCETGGSFIGGKPYMLASAGQLSLHGYNACMVHRVLGALQRNCREKQCETSFFPVGVFLFSRNSVFRFWAKILWRSWLGRPGILVRPPDSWLLRYSM